jgi:predicted RNA-binding Zn ribbon-like protein
VSDKRSDPARPAPILIGDHPALDFLNTLATPGDAPVEWLQSGDDLIGWLEQQGRIGSADAARCRRKFSADTLNTVAREARAFREWLRQFVKKRAGRPLSAVTEAGVRPVNALLAEGQVHWRVLAEPNAAPQMQTARRWPDARQLLQPLAEAAADLICNANFELIRACEGAGCTLMFLDKTKAHKRRWCSMDVCGNRAKAAAHRARQRA